MGNVVGFRVFGADGSDTCVRGFTGFGESIIARVEILALLGTSQLDEDGLRKSSLPSIYSEVDLSCSGVCHRDGRVVARQKRVTACRSARFPSVKRAGRTLMSILFF